VRRGALVVCAGSSTQLGREGWFELEIRGGRLVSAELHTP